MNSELTTVATPHNETSVGIVAINAQFVHTSPAIRILRNIANDLGIADAWILECNISDPPWKICERIVARKPAILGLSIYLWNRSIMLTLAARIKAMLPQTFIVAGGPEVSFDSQPLPGVDLVIRGNAEIPWKQLLIEKFAIADNKEPHIDVLPIMPAYRDIDLRTLGNRMVYLETSRGCPFRCAFCLSGRKDSCLEPWLNGTPQDLANEVQKLAAAGVKTVKFLDRTFNADPQRALKLFRVLAPIEGIMCHFEMCAELLDTNTINFLASAPKGKFQFEIGIQSLCSNTLRAIGRRTDTPLLIEKLKDLLALGTVHIHADLIWGLPEENIESCIEGFNTLYEMNFDELQLGFLKLLKGAPLSENHERWNYAFDVEAPYEVICHKHLSALHLLQLKKIEYVFNRFHNSKRFTHTIRHLRQSESLSPFRFFSIVADYFAANNLFLPALTIEKQCETLMAIFPNNELLTDYLRLDYTTSQRVFTLPRSLSLPHHKSISVKGAKNEHALEVPFEHELNCENLLFSDKYDPKVYRVSRFENTGYFTSVSVTPLGITHRL